jgi:dihydroorotase
MKRILIVNATVVNDGQTSEQDLYIRNGRIEKIDRHLGNQEADIVIDAGGKTLFPGMIDTHVHFRQPGFTHKGTIASESRAAVAGGITSFMDMPNTNPATLTQALLKEKLAMAGKAAFANYAFYLGASNDNIEEVESLDPKLACGIKLFMGASTGNMMVDNPATLERLFSNAPVVIAAHCEDTPTIEQNERSFREKYGEHIPVACHPLIRSRDACILSSTQAIDLARKFGTQLHLLHLSTEEEVALLSDLPMDSRSITAEACVHHLFFSLEDYDTRGALLKCNPAVKSLQDREALLVALTDSRIDTVGTDHAPHTLEEKQGTYFKVPSGISLIQHAFQSLLEHCHTGRLSLPLIAEKTAHAPARRFQLKDRGYIREGYWADLVLVDLNRPYEVDRNAILHHCGWSPFSGHTFGSTIDTTIVSGHLAWHGGKVDPAAGGKRLEFDRRG